MLDYSLLWNHSENTPRKVNRFPRGAAEFSLVSSDQIGPGGNPDS
jgi:hypothetical protein